ncbi:hypothetical protein INT47_000471 [Mucor saturninus]|uniref:F-box domain-containing protein n=1 Tax=Mucor saturninus TaxID=64648 RepID=A0A8H7QMF3_9FUNG|nr:hypothetical protein INT47_000471 [Mucor saturninus]
MGRHLNFPDDILDVIFGIIREESDFYSLLQCELVCKAWMIPAQRSLYTDIEFRSEKEVDTLIRALTKRPNSIPGKFTRSVVYNGHNTKENPKDTRTCRKIFEYLFGKKEGGVKKTPWIDSFVEIFPHVRNISLAKEDSSYFWILIKAFGSGKWKGMECIGKCPEEFADSHNACAMLNKDTLKTLHLCDDKENETCSLYDRLHLFPRLKKLYMATNQYSFFEYADYATEIIPGLDTLCYENLKDTDFNSLTPYKPVNLSLITPRPNIKNLVIQLTSYENDNFLLYLMTKFPKLQRVTINQKNKAQIHGARLDEIQLVCDNFSIPVLSKFMAFVSKCEDHLMDLLYTTQDPGDILPNYWSLCNPENPKVVTITYFEGRARRRFNMIEHNEDMVRIRMDVPSLLGSSVTLVDYPWLEPTLPHLMVLEKCGKQIDHLVLSVNHKHIPLYLYEEGVDVPNENSINLMDGFCFGHVIEYCTKLKVLHYYRSKLFSLFKYSRYVFRNTTITDLILEDVLISMDTMSQISERLPSLKRLRLRHVSCDSKILDTPLSLDSVIDMPWTSFRYLNLRNYMIDGVSYFRLPTNMLVHLTTENEEMFFKCKIRNPTRTRWEDIVIDTDDIEHIPEFLNPPRAVPIEEEEYMSRMRQKNNASVHVICKSLNYLVLAFDLISPTLSCFVLVPDKETDVSTMSDHEICAHYMSRDN